MRDINFSTQSQTFKQYVQEGIQERIKDYFYLGGKSAYVIPGKVVDNCQEAILKNKNQSKIKQIVAVISCITLAILLLKFVAKAAFRSTHTTHVANQQTDSKPANTTNSSATEVFRVKISDSASEGTSASDIQHEQKDPPLIRFVSADSAVLEQPNSENTVFSLMTGFSQTWNTDTKSFDLQPNSFDLKSFSTHLSTHADRFKKADVRNDQHFGYIEKFDLDPADKPQIYMRADLHGDLKSLLENIRSLQGQGLLDENFKCRAGVHLVFLGDYCDRGNYGTEILELLMRLREENPSQVHLIRGNHEYNIMNLHCGYSDSHLREIILDEEARSALERFYETMSLTTYFSINREENREYVQCTHGLFELTMDPAPLLDQRRSGDYLTVPKARELSLRVRTLANENSILAGAAQRIHTLVQQSKQLEPHMTVYNWGDVSQNATMTFNLGPRHYALSAQDIRHYLDLSSQQHRVMMLFRGHQHGFQHLIHEDKVLVTTLPVGMDCPVYQNKFFQPDRAYIIKPTTLAADWKKRAILREKGRAVTDEITTEFPLTSSTI